MKSDNKTADKTTTPDERVTLVNTRRSNGPVGATARPLAKDEAAWLARGWVRKT